jgi:methylenetetrahydrofolate dehydrogenase (NADP+) / methenyltetrahydrofolate cyclohydrolase
VGFSNVYGLPGLTGVVHEAEILDGRDAAAAIGTRVAAEVEEHVATGERAPSLATILVGDHPASEAYVSARHRACAEVEIDSSSHVFEADAASAEVEACIASLNDDPAVDGILLQLPLPAHLDAHRLVELIDPWKDVEGLTTVNMGRLCQGLDGFVPCTPKGILYLLDHYEIELAGRPVVVVGRSELVGRPLATLLSQRDCTVTLCHSRSRDLEDECRRAEILVAAAGRAHLISDEHVGHGAVVIDVGIHRSADGLIGDVDFEAIRGRASAVSPVPGGVGPMTIASLLENTLAAARADWVSEDQSETRKDPYESVR